MNVREKMHLLPCPFCGAPGRVIDSVHPRAGVYWVAECSADCEMAPTCTKNTEKEAAEAWNRRAPAAV